MSKQKPLEKEEDNKSYCGLVMPISSIDGCDKQHWLDVKDILIESIESAGFKSKLVSDADDVGIIQKRIIQNLYENPIIVCDVSGKNPNVMFELGMRLAFDKPTIIVKDEKTSYSFDTSQIEHLEYPRDLRFTKIVEFKEILKEKIKATYEKSVNDPSYTTFLKHFGTFTVSKLDSKEVSKEDFILKELSDLKEMVLRQEMILRRPRRLPEHTRYERSPPYNPSVFLQEENEHIKKAKYILENRDPKDIGIQKIKLSQKQLTKQAEEVKQLLARFSTQTEEAKQLLARFPTQTEETKQLLARFPTQKKWKKD